MGRIASYAEKCRGMRYKNKDISGSVPKARAAGDADNSAPTEWPVFPTYPPTTSPMGPSETTIPKTRMRHYRSRSSITMGGSNLKYEVTPQNISSRSSSYTRIPNLFGHVDSSQDGNSDNYGQPSRQRQLQPVPSEDSLQGSPIHADTANVKQENSGTIGVRLTESVSSPLMTKVSNISGGSGSSSSNDCDVGGNAELRKRLVRSAAEKHSYHHRPRSATRLAISPAPRKHSLPCSTEQWSRSGRKGHSRSLTPSSSASAIIQLLQNNREGLSPQGTRGQDSSLRSHRSPSISRTVAMKSLNHTLYKPSQLFEVKSPPPATTNIQYHHQQFIGARDITPYVSTTPISKSTSAQAMLGRSYSRRHSRNNSGGSTISNLSNYGHVRSNSASSLGTDAERDRGGGSNSRVPNSSIVATKRQTIDPRSSANPLLDKPEQYALSLLKPNTSTRVKNPTTTTMVDSSNGQSQDIVKSLSEGSVYQVPKTKRSDSKTVIDVQDTDDDDEVRDSEIYLALVYKPNYAPQFFDSGTTKGTQIHHQQTPAWLFTWK
ncbi:hypothetical protein H4219_006104 [Mycoemilia scoparia]|uniref:Uncharacterized protein n=1 Tax=Mycoemilia scoparia TaxID=417184 RepID=A0A9W8DMS8_9FUNG|nr:hypothetical protein H4219_006104 [Mycoemilia scoparia]